MRIPSLLTTTILIGIGYAAMSADEITKCLDDIATLYSDADTQAQKIDLVSFIGLQPVSCHRKPIAWKISKLVQPANHRRLLQPNQPRVRLRRTIKPRTRTQLQYRATATNLLSVQSRKSRRNSISTILLHRSQAEAEPH
jgi:hypothetical protein